MSIMHSGNSIRINMLHLLSAEMATKLIVFIITVAISRYLGVAGFGMFGFAISFAMVFGFIVDWGFVPLSIREIARDKSVVSKLIGNIMTLKIMLSGLMMVVVIAVSTFLGKTPEPYHLIVLAALYIIFDSFNGLLRGVFQAFGEMKYDALMRVSEKTFLLLAISFIIYHGGRMCAVMAAHAAAAFLIMLLTVAFIWKRYGYFRIEYDPRYCSKILKEGMAFVFTAAFVVMYFKIDSVMLSFMKGDEAVGYYTAAYNIIIALMVLPAIMAKVIYPSLSKDYFRSQGAYRGLLKKSLLFAVLFGAASVVGVGLFARSIILLLYGAAFVGAAGPLRILSLTFLLICITTVAGTALNAGNKQKVLALTTGAGVVINVVFNALLIPSYGSSGAAAATCLTQVFYALVLFSVLFNKNIRQGARA